MVRVTQGQENGPLGRMGEIVLKRDVIPQNIFRHTTTFFALALRHIRFPLV